jgi:hypothetical protein
VLLCHGIVADGCLQENEYSSTWQPTIGVDLRYVVLLPFSLQQQMWQRCHRGACGGHAGCLCSTHHKETAAVGGGTKKALRLMLALTGFKTWSSMAAWSSYSFGEHVIDNPTFSSWCQAGANTLCNEYADRGNLHKAGGGKGSSSLTLLKLFLWDLDVLVAGTPQGRSDSGR